MLYFTHQLQAIAIIILILITTTTTTITIMAVSRKQIGQVCWRPHNHPSQQHPSPEFMVAVDSTAYSEWKWQWQRDKDVKICLGDVVDAEEIFIYRGGGRNGHLERPNDQLLHDAFGTSKRTDCIEHVLKEGDLHLLPHGNEIIPGDRRPFRFHGA